MTQVLARARDRLPPFFLLTTDNVMYFTMRFTFHPSRRTAFQKYLDATTLPTSSLLLSNLGCNAFIERSTRTDNEECFRTRSFSSSEENRYYFRLWEDFYNHHRPHQSLNLRTPARAFRLLFPSYSSSLLL